MKPTCKASLNTTELASSAKLNTDENDATIIDQAHSHIYMGSTYLSGRQVRPVKNNYLRMKTRLLLCICFLGLITCQTPQQNDERENLLRDTIHELENDLVSLRISLYGGAYVGFTYKDMSLNPFTWKLTKEEMPQNNKNGAVFHGHFLCLGRWGSPTAGEKEAGVPHNGQASNTMWIKERSSNRQMLISSNYAPRDGMVILRTVKMDTQEPMFYVTEEIKNITTIARLNNVVQHATIGAPFLNRTTIINSNAGKGFNQKFAYPDPHAFAYSWPHAYLNKEKVSTSLESSDCDSSYVSTHLMEGDYGWVTAATPSQGLLLGYFWKTTDYPWLNLWHEIKDGEPWAKGLEFGTTGIGRSYHDLLKTDTRFHGVNSFELLDAGQSVSKSFCCFLLKIPTNYKGVESITLENGKLVIRSKEKAMAPVEITYKGK